MRKCKDALVIDASDLPWEVEEWCCEQEISTHYKNDLVSLGWRGLDDNPLVNWLKDHIDNLEDYEYVGIIAT
jgi:hypothetical protein